MSEKEFDAELTLKDRLNFPYLLANQILTYQKAILNMEYSEGEIREAIDGFVHMIPQEWKDDDFKKEMEKAEITIKIDMRPSFCGISASEKFCEAHKITSFKEKKTFDHRKVFQACMNLLYRKKMLSKIVRVEELESIDLDTIEESSLFKSDISGE